jgi:glucose-1-phosphate thymidylyltransferase
MHAFILAGGFATRLWPLTERRAKPLLPLAGKPLLDYLVQSIPLCSSSEHDGSKCKSLAIGSHLQLGTPCVSSITVSTNAVFQPDFAAWQKTSSVPVSLVIEDAHCDSKKLGALGAVSMWIQEEQIDDDVLLLAGDNYTEANLTEFIRLFRGNPLIAGHDLGSLEQAKQFGTILLQKGDHPSLQNVESFEEKPEHPRSSIVSTGWWILPRTSFPLLHAYVLEKPDNIGGIFEEFLAKSIPVDCFTFSDRWRDIGSFSAYLSLHTDVVAGRVLIHPTATVDADTRFEGSVVIGPHTHVTRSFLNNCMLFGDTTVHDCSLIDCIVDRDCSLQNVDILRNMIRSATSLRR